jgi:hypothetical protein
VRNYTVDVGLALFDQQFRDRANATEAIRRAKDLVSQKAPNTALSMVRLGLSLDPFLVDAVTKDNAFRDLRKLPEWQPMIDEAVAASQAQSAKAAARRAAAEAGRRTGAEADDGDGPSPRGPSE